MDLSKLISKFRLLRSMINNEDQKDDSFVEIETEDDIEDKLEGGDVQWTEDTITYYSWWFW